MSASAVRAGKAYVEIFADNTKLQAGLRKAQAQLRSFGAAVNAIGAGLVAAGTGILAPLGLAVRKWQQAGDALDKMSARTGMSVAALSRLQIAADYSGTTIEDVEVAVRKASRAMEEAYGGSEQMVSAFAAIGLSMADLKSMTPDQQFDAIAKAIADIKNPTDQAYATMLLFGKSSTQLLPMIQTLDETRQRADQFGAVMSRLDATKAADLNDSFADVRFAITGLVNVIASTLQPALMTVTQWFANTVKSVGDWVNKNRGLVAGLAAGGVAIVAIGGALLSIGTAANVASWALLGVSKSIGLLTASIAPLFGTIGLAAASIAGLGYAVYEMIKDTDAGRYALGALGQGFRDVQQDAITAWDGISAALQSGNIAGAVKVVWAFIKLEFTRGTALVMNIAQGFAAGVAKAFLHTGFAINYAFRWAFNKVMDIIQGVGGWMLSFFAGIVVKIGEMIRSIGLAVGASRIRGLAEAGYGTAELGANLIVSGANAQSDISKSVAERKSSRDQSLDDFGKTWDEKIGDVNDWLSRGMTTRDAEIAQREAELAAASAEMIQAKKQMDDAAQEKSEELSGMGKSPLGSLISHGANIKDTAAGAFNAVAAFGMGLGSTASDRTAAATEQTSKNTKAILEALKKDNGETFSP